MEYQLITPRIPRADLSAVERVLTNRGIALENIDHYLHTTDDDILDPMLLDNVEQGAKMLIKHISANDKVFLQVDSDYDGFSSSAALINYLNMLFPAFTQNNIRYRLHEGKQHGIILETIPEDVKLVIVPDAGSNDLEQHAALKNKGIDVLILDHHEADIVSTDACVINNQLCDYPTKSLSGVGIVYKFCSYIDSLLGTDCADRVLDLVASGMVADMMDLRDMETKHLVNKGMHLAKNPFFSMMVDKQSYSLKDGITPIGIAFYIAPYVNATIRMGTQEEKLTLFESMLDFKAYELVPSTKRGCKGQKETRVEQACRNCTNIKNRQTKARDAALETIEHIIEEQGLLENKILAVRLDKTCAADRNLTGLIANQLMAKYQRPVLLLNKTELGWEGSGRGVGNSKFDNLREFLKESGLVEYAEGHAQALGVGMIADNYQALMDYANTHLANFDFSPCYKVDFIFNGNDFNGKDIIEIAELKSLWGQGVDEPYIAVEHINVHSGNVALMSADKNPTLKISLPNGTSLIKFKSSKEEYEKLKSDTGCITINVVGRCERNIWNGMVSPQIIIDEYEITNTQQYYF